MLMAKSTEPGNPAYLLDAPHPPFWEKDCSGTENYKRWRFATSVSSGKSLSISAMMRLSRLRLRMADPLMSIESQNKWMLLRPMPLAQWCVSLALLFETASPAPAFPQGTPEQRMACTPDVLRLCSASSPMQMR
jgi:hypothetical protein